MTNNKKIKFKAMNIKIEKSITDLAAMPRVFDFIRLIEDCNTLEECREALTDYYAKDVFLSFGFGGSHLFLSYKFDRILIVTEKN